MGIGRATVVMSTVWCMQVKKREGQMPILFKNTNVLRKDYRTVPDGKRLKRKTIRGKDRELLNRQMW